MKRRLRVITADDEPLARRTLKSLVESVEWMELVGEAATGTEALELIDSLKPDVAFLDIRMPGPSGVEVVRRARHRPYIVFTTAYDQFAVTAFELQAVDYLLKPFGRRRFQSAIQRLAPAADEGDINESEPASRLEDLLSPDPIIRLYAREKKALVPIDVRDIERIEACDDYALVVTGSGSHLIQVRMRDLERRLDPATFIRVHRSHIVNVAAIQRMESLAGGRALVILSTTGQVPVSRTGFRKLKNRLY